MPPLARPETPADIDPDGRWVLAFSKMASGYFLRHSRSWERHSEDLAQAIAEQILTAIPRWSPEGGASLNTYLWARARGAMLDYWREADVLGRAYRAEVRAGTKADPTVGELSVEAIAEQIGTDTFGGYEEPAFTTLEEREWADSLLKWLRAEDPKLGQIAVDWAYGWPQRATAAEWQVTESRISQLKSAAVRMLVDRARAVEFSG